MYRLFFKIIHVPVIAAMIASCTYENVIDCDKYIYDSEDLEGIYEGDRLHTSFSCNSDTVDLPDGYTEPLDFFLELNSDGSGRIYGPDTLAEISWLINTISSVNGLGGGGCYHEFTIWTETERLDFGFSSVGEVGLGFYKIDSSWYYKDCHREKNYSFKRVE